MAMPEPVVNPKIKENKPDLNFLSAMWQIENPEDEWRHPLEWTTFHYILSDYVYRYLGKELETWLNTASDLEQMNFVTWMQKHRLIEIYKNLPKDERAKFLY